MCVVINSLVHTSVLGQFKHQEAPALYLLSKLTLKLTPQPTLMCSSLPSSFRVSLQHTAHLYTERQVCTARFLIGLYASAENRHAHIFPLWIQRPSYYKLHVNARCNPHAYALACMGVHCAVCTIRSHVTPLDHSAFSRKRRWTERCPQPARIMESPRLPASRYCPLTHPPSHRC